MWKVKGTNSTAAPISMTAKPSAMSAIRTPLRTKTAGSSGLRGALVDPRTCILFL